MKPLSLDMSDPLTLGMGHPVTERIRRLSMRKTNLLTRSGTCAVIIAALGISAPIFSGASASPVTEAVDTLAQQSLEPIVKAVSAPATVPQKLAEAAAKEAAPNAANTARKTGLKPMRLRMNRRSDQAVIDKVDLARADYEAGDKSAIAEINRLVRDDTRKNRFEVKIDDQGNGQLAISNGARGWPGFPASSTDWERRAMSGEMKLALRDIIARCAKAASPEYFRMTLLSGDADLGKGTYEIGCVPGSGSIQNSYSSIDLANAYLASKDLPLEDRQGNFGWKMGFAMMADYVKNTPNATIAKDREACVAIHTHLKTYDFIARNSTGVDNLLAQCPVGDYNWVRKQENLPLIQ